MDCEGQQTWLLEITENSKVNEKIFKLVKKELSLIDFKPLIKYLHVITEIPFVNIIQKVSDANPQSVAAFELIARASMERRIKKLHFDQNNEIAPELHTEVNNSRGKGLCSAILKFRATKIYISFGRNFVGSISSTCEYLIRKKPKYCSLVAIEKLKLIVAIDIPATETTVSNSATNSEISSQSFSRTESYASSGGGTDLTYSNMSTASSPGPNGYIITTQNEASWVASPDWKLPVKQIQIVKGSCVDNSPAVRFSNDQQSIEPSAPTFSMLWDDIIHNETFIEESRPLDKGKQKVSEIEPSSQFRIQTCSSGSSVHTYPSLEVGESSKQAMESNLSQSNSADQITEIEIPSVDVDLNRRTKSQKSENQKSKSKSKLSAIQIEEAELLDKISKLNQTVDNLQLQIQSSISEAKDAECLLKRFRKEKKLSDKKYSEEREKRENAESASSLALEQSKVLFEEIKAWKSEISFFESNQIKEIQKRNAGLRYYNEKEIKLCCDDFNDTNIITKGQNFISYKGILNHMNVCIKRFINKNGHGDFDFDFDFDNGDDKERVLMILEKQMSTYSMLRHPHIILLIGYCLEIPCLVYEYMNNGSLFDRLTNSDNPPSLPSSSSSPPPPSPPLLPPLSWIQRFEIFENVCSAIAYMHSREPAMVHFGVHPSNILLDENLKAKIGDSYAIFTPKNNEFVTVEIDESSFLDTRYVCPIYRESKIVHVSCDVYSLGILLWDLLVGISKTDDQNSSDCSLSSFNSKCTNPGTFTEPSTNCQLNMKLVNFVGTCTDWPPSVAYSLALIALECTNLDRNNRPSVSGKVIDRVGKVRKEVDSLLKDIKLAESFEEEEKRERDREKEEKKKRMITPAFLCPITMDVMECPVVASDGHTYEKEAIEIWLSSHETSPVTNLQMPDKELRMNHIMKTMIQEYLSKQSLDKDDV